MRLLLVCPSWGRYCGIASYTRSLRAGLAAHGVETDVATHPTNIRQLVEEKRYDGILLQHEYSLYFFNLLGILNALEKSGAPLVITMHNSDNGAWMGAQHLFLFRTPARFVVHSQAARENLGRAEPPLDHSRVTVIPMGCPDYDTTFGPTEVVRAELGLPADRFVVGFFGFAAAHKNIPNLVRALFRVPMACGYIHATTHPTNPKAVDAIYQECGLPRLSRDRNTYANVTLCHAPIPDEKFGRYQNAMDVIILPYSQHAASISTSMLAYEALASRRAVVTTDAVYFSELKDEVMKIPDARPETIANAVGTLCNTPQLRQALIAQAATYAERNRWPHVAARYLELLR